MEILYSKSGQTADEMIERAAHRLSAYGEVLVVTDDHAERETISAMGGLSSSCSSFMDSMKSALCDLQSELKHHNRRELSRFKQAGK
jgi:predicted RNA-binding protein with PIN domain